MTRQHEQDSEWLSTSAGSPGYAMTDQPRSTRAVSDDGLWLVQLVPHRQSKRHTEWLVSQLAGSQGKLFAMPWDHIPDTGQRAEEVLAAWEEQSDGR